MINHTILTLNKKTTLAFILIFTTIVVFDSSIDTFSSYSGVELQSSQNVAIFITFYIFFLISSIILLNAVKKIMSGTFLHFKYFQAIIIAIQILSGAFMLVIILQMLLMNKYNISLLHAQTYLSHFSALVF